MQGKIPQFLPCRDQAVSSRDLVKFWNLVEMNINIDGSARPVRNYAQILVGLGTLDNSLITGRGAACEMGHNGAWRMANGAIDLRVAENGRVDLAKTIASRVYTR